MPEQTPTPGALPPQARQGAELIAGQIREIAHEIERARTFRDLRALTRELRLACARLDESCLIWEPARPEGTTQAPATHDREARP